MISGENIGKLIADPRSLKSSQLTEMQELIEKYPYCSSLYIIHLIGLSAANDISFEKKLKIAASHVSDREHLYALVNGDGKAKPVEKIVEKSLEKVVEEVEEIEDEAVDQNVVPETKTTEPVTAKISEQEKITIPLDLTKEIEESEVEEEEELSDLEVGIMSSVVESALNIEKEKKKKKAKKGEKKKKKKKKKKKVVDPSKMSFTEWLIYKQEQAIGEEGISVSKKKKQSKDSKSMSKKEINELLDKFIDEEPKISSPSADSVDSSKTAKRSLEESVDMVTETLAQIHVMQGNYAKAISAYKQLSLLYPEKKAFFATQIEKIKEKQN